MATPPMPPLPKWATYIPSRSPQHKMHNTRGQAHNAVANKFPDGEGHVFEFVDGDWKISHSYYPPDECAWCKGDFWTQNPYSHRRHLSRYVPRSQEGPNFKRDVICASCYNKDEQDRRVRLQEERERAEYERLAGKYGNR